jgi:hypothetical protein
MATIWDRIATVEDPFLPVATGPRFSLADPIKQLGARPRKAREFKR